MKEWIKEWGAWCAGMFASLALIVALTGGAAWLMARAIDGVAP